MRRVVVTGIGTINPCGLNASQTWQFLLKSKSAVGPITHFDCAELPVQIAAEVKGFEPSKYMGSKLHKRMDRFSQFAYASTQEATEMAGLSSPLGPRTGVYVGTGIGGIREIEDGLHRMKKKGYKGLGAMFIPKCLANLSGGHIAIALGATGPNISISTACAAGNFDSAVRNSHSAQCAWPGLSLFNVTKHKRC